MINNRTINMNPLTCLVYRIGKLVCITRCLVYIDHSVFLTGWRTKHTLQIKYMKKIKSGCCKLNVLDNTNTYTGPCLSTI